MFNHIKNNYHLINIKLKEWYMLLIRVCEMCTKKFKSERLRKTCSQKCKNKRKYNNAKKNNCAWFIKNNYSARKRLQNKKSKDRLISFKGGSCRQFNYSKCSNALEFHHNNGKKEFQISVIKNCKFEKMGKIINIS